MDNRERAELLNEGSRVGYQCGIEDERARIVAWLREQSALNHSIAAEHRGDDEMRRTHISMSHTQGCAADAIERLDHLAKGEGRGAGGE